MSIYKRSYHVDEARITLPKGTRVVLRVDRQAEDGTLCKAATVGVVVEVAYERYVVRTPAGRRVACQRDQLALQKHDQLPALAERQHDFEALSSRVFFSAIVGSTAWGLSGAGSDRDVRGAFILPFELHAGLFEPPDEIQHPARDEQYWEVQKLVFQGLRGDAGTLELLWSPHLLVCDELGEALRAQRAMFISQHVFGTFGRYAISQFRKMRAAETRRAVQRAILDLLSQHDEALGIEQAARELVTREICRDEGAARAAIRDLYCSLFDRGLLAERGFEVLVARLSQSRAGEGVGATAGEGAGAGQGVGATAGEGAGAADELARALQTSPRWKNAYNLLRLLRSGIALLEHGEPLIVVEGEARDELLAVKAGEWALERVLARADELSGQLEAAFAQTKLPREPDYAAADAFVVRCRRRAAAEHLAARLATSATSHTPTFADRPPVEPTAADLTAADLSAAEPPTLTAERRFELPDALLEAFCARYDGLDFVVASVVGSHSYGFPSRDSDVDLKAIHLLPTDALLGLDTPEPTVSFLDEVEHDGHRVEIDFTSHEARFALERLLRGDGNVLERIMSPYLVCPAVADVRLSTLRALAMQNLSRRFYRHYRGFFGAMVKRYLGDERGKLKTLLYIYRVALTGVCLLERGEVCGDIEPLLERYELPQVRVLLERKAEAELTRIGAEQDAPYVALISELEARLDRAHERSSLPDEPPARAALDAWLRSARR